MPDWDNGKDPGSWMIAAIIAIIIVLIIGWAIVGGR